jgi:hypothetical protein
MYTRTLSRQVAGTQEVSRWLMRDGEQDSSPMKFELDKKEYFTGLASLLEVLAEMLEKSRKLGKPPTTHHIELLRALREELEFLQDTCHIIERRSE